MPRRLPAGVSIVLMLFALLFSIGYFADPSWPSAWDAWTPLKYVVLGVLVLALETVLEAIVVSVGWLIRQWRRALPESKSATNERTSGIRLQLPTTRPTSPRPAASASPPPAARPR